LNALELDESEVVFEAVWPEVFPSEPDTVDFSASLSLFDGSEESPELFPLPFSSEEAEDGGDLRLPFLFIN
jgi:hypothetical protein